MKKIYLVDVSSLFFRAFYAIRRLSNSKGLPTNALYGFLASIAKILKEHKPEGVVFCYDLPGSGFREELYPEYKANRDETPTDLVKQVPYISKLADALSIPGYEKEGFEADDIIGCLTQKSKGQGYEVVIVSGDKDLSQLVEPGVTIYDPSKDIVLDSAGVKAKLGVQPNQVVDYLALVGDSSDNVPGVRGIGPKGAQKLLDEFHTLDGIYENVDKIKNDRVREMLKAQKDSAYLSRKLCTIHCDIDLAVKIDDLKVKSIKRELLVPLLEELEFKAMISRLLGSGEGEPEIQAPSPVMVQKQEVPKADLIVTPEVSLLQAELEKVSPSELWLDVTPRGIAIQIGKKVFRYEGDSQRFTEWLNENSLNRSLSVSGYDSKSIAVQLNLDPKSFSKIGHDPYLEAYCTGKGDDVELPALLKKYLSQELPEFAFPEERLMMVKQLSLNLQSILSDTGTSAILEKVERPLVPVLYEMERHGILVDSQKLENFSKELAKESQTLEKEICKLAGYDFNIGSPKQLGQVLFEKLKLPTVRKTKTGYSTDSDVLETLKSQHPICEKILEWREITKLKSTYVDALPRLVDAKTHRVHTSYHQAVTSTGRLSSTHPNLQNIPIRSSRGQQIRESFVAPKGSLLVSADYSQVELRILAHITDDPGLRRAFESDIDIHTATASEVFDVPLSEVTADQRRASKAINFGIAYGMSDFGLAESLKIDRKVAAEFIAKYFQRFPGVQQYMHEIVETGKKQGYVETLYGRRRYYPEIKSPNGRVRQMAERAVINMPIQGAAADIIKMAMIEVWKHFRFNSGGSSGRMLLQVHDELVFEVHKDEVEGLKSKVRDWMESTTKLSVPLKVSVDAGENWGVAH